MIFRYAQMYCHKPRYTVLRKVSYDIMMKTVSTYDLWKKSTRAGKQVFPALLFLRGKSLFALVCHMCFLATLKSANRASGPHLPLQLRRRHARVPCQSQKRLLPACGVSGFWRRDLWRRSRYFYCRFLQGLGDAFEDHKSNEGGTVCDRHHGSETSVAVLNPHCGFRASMLECLEIGEEPGSSSKTSWGRIPLVLYSPLRG